MRDLSFSWRWLWRMSSSGLYTPRRMVSSGLLRRVALVRATRRNNPEDTILHSHRRENLKSYIIYTKFVPHRKYITSPLQNTVSRRWLWRMPSSGMWRCGALVRTDDSEECTAWTIRVQRMSGLGKTLAVTSILILSSLILSVLVMEMISSSETSVRIIATRRHIPEGGILHSHLRDNFKSYKSMTLFNVYFYYSICERKLKHLYNPEATKQTNKNSVHLVRKRTIPNERPPLVSVI
jgi:hypothetical protein